MMREHPDPADRHGAVSQRAPASTEIEPPTRPMSSRHGGRERRGGPLEGFALGKVLGIVVAVDWSLLVIFALITFNLGAGLFPRWRPDWPAPLTWAVALAAATSFFGSVLLHELSHALVARRHGIEVRRITLFLFGGVAHMEREATSPRAEFSIAFVGPVTSLAIGGIATLIGVNLAGGGLAAAAATENPALVAEALRDVGPLALLLLWLGPINITLALFNLVPGFPLDGGRVLRSVLWALTHDLTKATRWASRAGQGFALVLVAIGVYNLLGGAVGSGLWMLLIGWFLNNAARQTYAQVLLRQALQAVPLARVMRTRVMRVAPELPVDEFVRDYVMQTDQQAFPVEADNRSIGLVRFSDLSKLPQSEWSSATVSHVMTRLAELPSLPPNAGAEEALERLTERDVEQLPVVDREHVIGLVSRSDLIKWLALRGEGQAPASFAESH